MTTGPGVGGAAVTGATGAAGAGAGKGPGKAPGKGPGVTGIAGLTGTKGGGRVGGVMASGPRDCWELIKAGLNGTSGPVGGPKGKMGGSGVAVSKTSPGTAGTVPGNVVVSGNLVVPGGLVKENADVGGGKAGCGVGWPKNPGKPGAAVG